SGADCSSAAWLIASAVQLSVGTPSTSTVQAPQDESSQPRLEPVSCNSWRRTSSSSSLGSIASSCLRPFTRSSMSSFFMKKQSAISKRPEQGPQSPQNSTISSLANTNVTIFPNGRSLISSNRIQRKRSSIQPSSAHPCLTWLAESQNQKSCILRRNSGVRSMPE